MYIDAANRKIKEPIDYLIEAKKKYKKLGAVLTLAECPELAREADILNAKINRVLSEKPIEEWETLGNAGCKKSLKTSGEAARDRHNPTPALAVHRAVLPHRLPRLPLRSSQHGVGGDAADVAGRL